MGIHPRRRRRGRRPHGGMIAVGAPADLTVFGGDPVACAVDELPGLPIVATVVAGDVVHRSSDA